jgi:three-Cys-motif partner protein
MSVSETVWKLTPHTAKKHEILRRYFQAWLPILATTQRRLLYIDGFAGPGEYQGGAPGSPLVILNAARDHRFKFTSELVCVFIESRKDRYDHLLGLLDKTNSTLPRNIKFQAIHGTFNEQLTQIFANVDEQKRRLAPTLAFLDPFGFSQTPFGTIVKLMKNPMCEVFVNVMYEEINRFLSIPDQARHFDSLFDRPEWRQVIEHSDPVERFRGLHDLYLKQLRTVAKYARSFLMVNMSNMPDYLLFFATNNLMGLKKMKEAMWKVDPTGEFQFSDYTDADTQLQLFGAKPDFELLRRAIARKFSRTEIAIEVVEEWVLSETPYLDTHIRKHALTPMERDDEKVSVVNPKPGRRRFTYPDGTILRFR